MSDTTLTADEILNRLKLIFNINSDAKLAELLDISRARVANWRRRNTKDYEHIVGVLLAKKPDFDINLLFKNPQNLPNSQNSFSPIRVGAGSAIELQEDQFVTAIPVPKELARPGVIPGIVFGDSMYPRLKEGNIILIDTREKNIISNEMYCLRIPHEGLVVKRLFKVLDKVIVRSDNDKYPEFQLTFDELSSYETPLIVGIVSGIIEFRNRR